MKNRWSESARAASAASRLAKYGPMMGLQPWGDAARAAAYAARAEREVLDRLGVSTPPSSRSPGGVLGLGYGAPAADYGKPGITSASGYEERQADYEAAFRGWLAGVRKTEGDIAAFHALVAAAGGAAAAGMGAYRQASGQSPVAGMSSAFGRAGRYVTGKEPVYDSSGVLSGWAKTGGRPYSRAFNQPVRPPYLKAGEIKYDSVGRMIDPATGRVIGRVRYSAETGGAPGGRVSRVSREVGVEGRPYRFGGREYQDFGAYSGALQEYYRDMQHARAAGARVGRSGDFSSEEDALIQAGYKPGTDVGDAFLDGLRETAAPYEAVSPGNGEGGGLDAGGYALGEAAYQEGRTVADVVAENGLKPGTGAYEAVEKGWLDGAGLEEADDGSFYEDGDALSPVPGGGLYAVGVDASRNGMTIEETAAAYGIREGTDAYMELEHGYRDAAGLPDETEPDGDALSPVVAGGRELNPFDIDPEAGEEYMQYLRDADTAWEAEMAAKGLDPQGYPLAAPGAVYPEAGADSGGAGAVKEAAPSMDDAQIRLSQALNLAVKSQTAKDAARALGLLQGQWGVDANVASQIPPELLGDYERGFAEGAAGYDYSVQAPHDRAGVIRRVNAYLNGRIGDDDPMGFWPDHLTGANETRWAEREGALAEGRKGAAGESTAGLLEAAMNWLTTSLAENDKDGVNASLSYMADTLAAIQADARDVYLVRKGEDDDGEEVDAAMPEYDEDGNEVEDTDRIFEDSFEDPNAIPPWDFEKDGFENLFRGLRNRARRASCAVGAERAKADVRRRSQRCGTANRWSDAARAASAAARLAAYGPMMGMKPWGSAARAASAAARAGRGSASGGRTGGGTRGGGGSYEGVSGGGQGVVGRGSSSGGNAGGGTSGGSGGSGGRGGDWNDAVESYGEKGVEGMTQDERRAVFDEIKERSEKGEKLTEQDRGFLNDLEAFLDAALKDVPKSDIGVSSDAEAREDAKRRAAEGEKKFVEKYGREPITDSDMDEVDSLGGVPKQFRWDAEIEEGQKGAGEWKAVQDPEQKPNGFMPLEAYDSRIEEAEEKGDHAKARRLRRERNNARKNDAKERLRAKREERAKARPGGRDLYAGLRESAGIPDSPVFSSSPYDAMKARGKIKSANERTAKDLVRDNAGKVWDLRDPNGGWESRGGTPVAKAVYYSNGKLYDADGKYLGKAPKSKRSGAVFVGGRWFDAATGKAIPSGAASNG